MYNWYDIQPTVTDENQVIPFWTGDDDAINKMLEKVTNMSDTDLQLTWKGLIDYDPRNYWNKVAKIGMDTWADAVRMGLETRGLSTT